MRAELCIVVRGGRVVELNAPPPLGAKVLSGPEVVLVGTAASLVAGDHLSVRLDIGPGDRLAVRSVAAQLALPCGAGQTTAFEVEAHLGAGARLAWRPEPLVAAAGARHRSGATLHLGAGAAALWVDEVLLGRCGGGRAAPSVTTTLHVDLDGRPLLRDGLCTAVPGWSGPAVAGDARYLGAAALLGWHPPGGCGPPWAALAGPGALARVVDADPLAGRAALARAADGPGLALMEG